MTLNQCDRVISGAVRDLAGSKGYEQIDELLETDRDMRQRGRKYPKILEVIGEH